MVKMGKKKTNQNRSGKSGIDVERGNNYIVFAAGTSGTIVINPVNFGLRLQSIADLYTQFRFTDLEFSFVNTVTSDIVAGWYPGVVGTAPSTVGTIGELECVAVDFGASTVPAHLRVSRSKLIGEASNKWFKCGAGTDADNQGEQQGTFCYACSVSCTFTVMVRYTIEFCGKADPTSIPLARTILMRQSKEERQRFLSSLDGVPMRGLPGSEAVSGAGVDSPVSGGCMQSRIQEVKTTDPSMDNRVLCSPGSLSVHARSATSPCTHGCCMAPTV
jgi:hypothetical protein